MPREVSNVLNDLKVLSDTADSIICEHNLENKRVKEWFSMIKDIADSIVNGTDEEELKLPDLVSFVKGTQLKEGNGNSSLLAGVQKGHVRRGDRKSRSSLRRIILTKKSTSNVKTSSPKRSATNIALGSTTPNEKTSIKNQDNTPITHSKKKSDLVSDQSIERKTDLQSTINNTPKSRTLTSMVNKKNASKNSIEKFETFIKKGSESLQKNVTASSGNITIIKNAETPQNQYRVIDLVSSEESVKMTLRCSKRKSSVQLGLEYSKKTKTTGESYISSSSKQIGGKKKASPTNKESFKKVKTAANTAIGAPDKRILKEIQKKETKTNQNTQKLKSLQKIKAEENKKARELKMEKAMQQRIMLKKEKEDRLRCLSQSRQEKEQQKEPARIKRGQKKELEVIPPISSKKADKNIVSVTSPEKISSSKKAPPKPVRTPAKKTKTPTDNTADKLEINVNKIDKTFISSPSVKEVFTKPTVCNTTYVSSPAVKSNNLTSTPKVENTLHKTPVSNSIRKLKSYTMTPCESSFVSYDMSEIKSDDSDEEETCHNKRVPSWASGVALRTVVLNQHYNPIDTNVLFGNYFKTPDLVSIMGVKKQQYYKRTSSAIWTKTPNRSFLS